MENTIPPPEDRFSSLLLNELEHFLKNTQVQRLSNNLRNIMFLSILRQEDNHPVFWFELIDDLYSLFWLLDVAIKEQCGHTENIINP